MTAIGIKYRARFIELAAKYAPFLTFEGFVKNKPNGTVYVVDIKDDLVYQGRLEFFEVGTITQILLYPTCDQRVYIGIQSMTCQNSEKMMEAAFFKVLNGLNSNVMKKALKAQDHFERLNEVLPPALHFDGDVKKFCDLLYLHFQNSPDSKEYDEAKARFYKS